MAFPVGSRRVPRRCGFGRRNQLRQRLRTARPVGSTHSPVAVLLPFDRLPSGSFAVVIIQHSAQPLTAMERSPSTTARLFPQDQLVLQPLVIPLVMIMH